MEAEATNIPPGIEVDIEGMEIGTAVHAGDLTLPSGVTLAVDPEILVLHVIAAPTAEQIEAELGAARGREEAEAGEAPSRGSRARGRRGRRVACVRGRVRAVVLSLAEIRS